MKRLHNLQKLMTRRKELRNNATPTELLLWSKLKHSQLGFKFRRQHSIGGYIVDFYCPKKRIVIELDGKEHFTNDVKEYDKNRTQSFEFLGIKVIRFSNLEVDKNIEKVLNKIKFELSL